MLLMNARMSAQSKTQNERGLSRRSPLIQIRSAYRRVANRFSLTIQAVKNQLLNSIQRQGGPEEGRPEEPYFWVETYNAALLEADPRQIPRRVQYALRAVDERRGALERGKIDFAERNLLQYAEIVLSQMTGSTPLPWRPQGPRAPNPAGERKAA
jgi:hypothetical protein